MTDQTLMQRIRVGRTQKREGDAGGRKFQSVHKQMERRGGYTKPAINQQSANSTLMEKDTDQKNNHQDLLHVAAD